MSRKASSDYPPKSLIGFRKLYKNKLGNRTFTLLIFKIKKNQSNRVNSSSESLICKNPTPFDIDPFSGKYFISDDTKINSNQKYTFDNASITNEEQYMTKEDNINFNTELSNYCQLILPTTMFHSVIKKCEKSNFTDVLHLEIKEKIIEKIKISTKFSIETFKIQKDQKFHGVSQDDALNEILTLKEFKIRKEKTSEDEIKSIPSYLTSQEKLKKSLNNSIKNKGVLILYLSFSLLLLLPLIFAIIEYILTIQIWDYISIQTDSFQKSYKIIEATGDIHYIIRHLLFKNK